MTKGCEFEKLFESYFRGDLSPAEELNLQKHLLICSQCSKKIDDFYSVHLRLSSFERPPISDELLNAYYKQVDLSFGKETVNQRIALFINRFISKPPLIIRIAQFALLLVTGIIVGWFIFSPPEPEVIMQFGTPYQTTLPVTKENINSVYYYLQASEIVLLEIQNAESYLDRELAQSLLIKTFRVHEIALQLNNVQILKFLTHMELILYEASNLKDDEEAEVLETIRMVIRETDLIVKARNLQSALKIIRAQSGT
jgi:hypothetical protein